MAVAAAARNPDTRNVGQYDPWNDPIFRQWERQQIEEQEKLAAKAKMQVLPDSPEATQLSQLVSGIDQRKQNFANQGAVNVQQALWQPLSANNLPVQSGASFGLKSGGVVTVAADHISYDKAAAKDIIAIETGILSMKAQNHASVVISGTDESFKANAWAYAQLHGLDVQGYVPTPEARALAAQLKSQRQGLSNVGDAPFGAPSAAGAMRGSRPDLRVVADNPNGGDQARNEFYRNGPPAGAQQQEPADKQPSAKQTPATPGPVTLNEAQKEQFQKLFAQQVEATNAVPLIQGHQKNMVAAQAAAVGKADDSPEALAAKKATGTYQFAFDNRVNNGMETAVRDLNVNKATRDAFGTETKKALTAHHAEAAEARAETLAKSAQAQAPAAAASVPVALNEAQKGQFQQLFVQQVEATSAVPLIQGHHKNMVAAQSAAAGKPEDSPEAQAAKKASATYQFAFDNRVNNGMETAVRGLSVDKATREAFAAQTRAALSEHHANQAGQAEDGNKGISQRVSVDPASGGARHRFGALRQEAAAAVDVTPTNPAAAGATQVRSSAKITRTAVTGDPDYIPEFLRRDRGVAGQTPPAAGGDDQIPEFLRKGPATDAERQSPPGALEKAAEGLRSAVARARARRTPGSGGPTGAG